MASKTIAWTTGGGNITLSYSGQGNGSVSVSSSENSSFEARSQSIYLSTTLGSPAKNIAVTITQQGKSYSPGDVFNFNYTGSVQSIVLPKGKYKLQCWGAQGGTSYGSSSAAGSKGGYSEGVLTLTEITTLYIFVGGQGSRGSSSSLVNGGWNGGGASVGYSYYQSGDEYGESYPACGGGATDIALVTSSMSYSSGRTNRSSKSLLSRIIVAGGGAGGSYRYSEVEERETEENIIIDDDALVVYGYKSGEYDIRNAKISFTVRAGRTYSAVFNYNTTCTKWLDGFYDTSGNTLSNPYTPSSDTTINARAIMRDLIGSATTNGSVHITVTESYTTTNGTTTSSGNSNKAQQGGGTSGKGQYPGTQSAGGNGNGNDGGFGYGGNQTTTNYRYVSGGAGGGWYGGGTAYSDSSTSYINYTGGGSGFVNTAANASYRPSGYTGLQLDSGTTTAGNTSHPSISGGTETGHSGNGYARITVIE